MRKLLFAALIILYAFAGATLLAQSAEQPATGTATVASETTHAEAHGEGHEKEKTYFGIPAWILKLVNMIVFFGLLVYLIGGPVKKSFADRREQIKEQLAEARARRDRAEHLADEIRGKMEQLQRDVDAILQRAQEEGERQKQEMIAAGHAEAEKVLATARNEVDARVKTARTELTKMAGELATQRAATLLGTSITDDDRRNLFDEGVKSIEEAAS